MTIILYIANDELFGFKNINSCIKDGIDEVNNINKYFR